MTDFTKDPDAVLKYTFDWSLWLETGETISTATLTATGATVDSQGNTDSTGFAVVSGGVVGVDASLQCRITTNGGQTDDRTMSIAIAEQ